MGKKGLIFFVCILAIVVVCVYKYNIFMSGENPEGKDQLVPASSIAISEEEANKISKRIPLRLYYMNESGTMLRQEIRYIPDSQVSKGSEYIAGIIINELIKGPTVNSNLKTLLSKETKINSLKIEGNTATVDLSKGFFKSVPTTTKTPVVTMSPATTLPSLASEPKEASVSKDSQNIDINKMMLYSIVNSLAEWEGISEILFKVDGDADSAELKNVNMQGVQKKKDDIIDRTVKN